MIDTIDFKFGEANANLINEEPENHPDVVRERIFQLNLLKSYT